IAYDNNIRLICDDGVGFYPVKAGTILSGKGTGSAGGTNIAVYNTHRRLKILYGTEYGLTYSSRPGQGIEVQIRIPAQKENRSPYSSGSEGYGSRMAPALSMVSATAGEDGGRSVTPEKLLR